MNKKSKEQPKEKERPMNKKRTRATIKKKASGAWEKQEDKTGIQDEIHVVT